MAHGPAFINVGPMQNEAISNMEPNESRAAQVDIDTLIAELEAQFGEA